MNKNLIFDITKKVDKEFEERFKENSNIKSIFVVGSMADMNKYIGKKDNDYDIRIVAKKVNNQVVDEFREFLEETSKKIGTEDMPVSYSTAVGPVNHANKDNKPNFLIHGLVHKESQLDSFLPNTHKYSYSQNYRIVDGEDCLEKYKTTRFDVHDILHGHEGLNYCIDMLEKNEYRYLDWDTSDEFCDFTFYKKELPKEMINESCFYSINKNLKNIEQYCNWNELQIPKDKVEYAISLLGDKFDTPEIQEFLSTIIVKDVDRLNELTNNPIKLSKYILRKYKDRINEIGLDKIYKQKELQER